MNNAIIKNYYGVRSGWIWLRSNFGGYRNKTWLIDLEGNCDYNSSYNNTCTICPVLHLNIESVLSAQRANTNALK